LNNKHWKNVEMTKMMILTTPIVEGYTIKEYKGLVTAKNVRALNIIRDTMTSFRDFFGGRSGSYQEVMDSIQQEVIDEIIIEAEKVGANGIIGFRIDFENVGSKDKSLIMAFATGTAVVIEQK